MRKCCCVAVGIGICLCCVVNADTFEATRPSAAACSMVRSPPPDLGPPPGCDDGSLPHNKMGWVSFLANSSASSTTATTMVGGMPTVGYLATDAEDAGSSDEGPQTFGLLDRNARYEDSIFNLVHPDKSERLDLIRLSCPRA